MLEPIEVETIVEADREAAFDAFVTRIGDWWPMNPFSMSRGVLTMEPVTGGQIVETSASGERFVWGHVTGIDRPDWIELAWYVGSTVETATQIEVRFTSDRGGETIVRLVQSGWEALGDKAAQIRDQNNGGWRQILGTCFANFVLDQPKDSTHV